MTQPSPTHSIKPKKAKRPVSANLLLVVVAITAVVGFLAGTRSDQIIGAIAPVFGVNIHTGEIDLSSVQNTYQALKANYDGTIDDAALIEGASRGLVDAVGDEYTLFMNAEESSAFDDDLSGNIGGGIGAEIGLRDDNVTIIRTLAGNPAEEAGLHAGDTVVRINDQSTTGLTVDKAVALIRGEEGTTVKLSVLRASEVKEFTVTRAIISNPSVQSSVTDGIGTLTISRFDSETGTLARAAAQDFASKDVRGVVLDLRGNGGGYLTAAQDVAGIWLNDKVVVSEKTNGKVVEELRTGSNPILEGVPTSVLVNAGSASASEIVAGALQDHKAAKLVGEMTFGKGSVQKLVALPGGAQVKVTVARWYTPNGKNITEDGISPDVTAALTQEDVDAGVDPQLEAAKTALGL